jgi:serine phosphatase RsbU (regulator of sigma subunit)
MAELAEQARLVTDPSEVIANAVEAIGKFFRVDRCAFADIDVVADTCTIPFNYCADESVASIVSTFPISGFGEYLISEFEAGRTVFIDDVNLEPQRMPPHIRIAYESITCRAFIAAPVLHSSRLMSVIALHSATPRHWDIDDVELLQMVTERTWLTVEVLRQDRALALAEAQSRVAAEREALIGRIALALRSSTDPMSVLEIAVRELGIALGVDHCYVAAYDQKNDTATINPEWHIEGRSSLIGSYRLSGFSANRTSRFREGLTQVIPDTTNDLGFQQLGIQAIIRVPLVAGESLAALVVAMAHQKREWTLDEIVFVETVASQTQTALEAVRLRAREHQIAHDLQATLQPAVPKHLPNLSLGSFTKAALDESSIGGDFIDVFEVEDGRFALIIADVSGKGLLAAAQLALVRNTLRTTLYLFGDAGIAANSLNAIVTSNNLLAGFVTLFIGIYDSAFGEITYVCCGHPPGLVRRLGGSVEELKNSGLPIGVNEKIKYGERSFILNAGESLFLYTDGLSEAGPTRHDMLDVEGLISIVGAVPEDADAQSAAEQIVERVSEYANGVFQDDVAVLCAKREPE